MNNRKYTINKKNGGIIPQLPEGDKRVLKVPVSCGKCKECMKKKAREWTIRLKEELKVNKTGQFVTLTFDTEALIELEKDIKEKAEGYALDNAIATLGVRRFLERWRKKYKVSVKHWLVTELGGGRYEHLHIHGIIFNEDKEEIKKIWKYGFVFIGDMTNEITINYIVKYIGKQDLIHKEYKPKILCSPGIGKNYIKSINARNNGYKGEKTDEHYRNKEGNKIQLPTYYRNNIYTDEEKEELWIKKLDENVRWVNGIKINMNDKNNKYNEILEEAQRENTKLGYGSDKINWDARKYENDRRTNLVKARLCKK